MIIIIPPNLQLHWQGEILLIELPLLIPGELLPGSEVSPRRQPHPPGLKLLPQCGLLPGSEDEGGA